jgi:hypothetical protein
MRFSPCFLASSLCLFALAGCEEEAPVEAAAPALTISPVSLTVARRSDGAPPANAFVVEVAPEGLVAGAHTLPLDGGRMPDAAFSGAQITELAAALDEAGRPSAVVVKAHASVPYITVSRALATLSAKGVRSAYFAVRSGAGAEVGHLPIDLAGARLAATDPVVFSGPGQRQWQEFVDVWDEVHTACEGEGMVDCASKPVRIAEGGLLEIELFTRQDAMRLLFRRHGVEGETVEEPPPILPPQNTRARPTAEQARAMDRRASAAPPPARSADFMWRRRAAIAEPSPISLALRPLCGARPCAVRMTADNLTPISSVLQLLGAAFPNGAPVPILLWEYPER